MKSVKKLYSIVSSLKGTSRQGWLHKGMKSDTIASHIYGAMCIGMFIAKEENVNTNVVTRMLLVHDWVMAKMEDVTPKSGQYDQKRILEEKAKFIISDLLPKNMKCEYLSLFDEFNEMITPEAQVAREADKLETLFQGETFEEETKNTDVLDGFFETYKNIFKTKTGLKIFEELHKRDLVRKNTKNRIKLKN